MPVHAKQIFMGRPAGAGDTTLYTVISGQRLILRDIRIKHHIATAAVALSIAWKKGIVTGYFLRQVTNQNDMIERTDMFMVFDAGDSLVVNMGTGNTYMMSFSGTLLDL